MFGVTTNIHLKKKAQIQYAVNCLAELSLKREVMSFVK